MRLRLLRRLFAHETYRFSDSVQQLSVRLPNYTEFSLRLVSKRAVAPRGTVGVRVGRFLTPRRVARPYRTLG
jgi:hypothetical protein